MVRNFLFSAEDSVPVLPVTFMRPNLTFPSVTLLKNKQLV